MSNSSSKQLELPYNINVRDLAQRMDVSPIQVIKILMTNGVMASINQVVDFDTAAVVASELGFEPSLEQQEEIIVEEVGEIPLWRKLIADEESQTLETRPPVVTILGHVDHGKTTLLDAIRHSNVAGGEAGGITQHIAAYQVEHKGRLITFLDTPGHAAFTSMRARGAQGADVVILVVAADDGVMPQTREAANHAKAARVPIVVAINKVDKPGANLELTKKQLADIELIPDEWDGDTIMVPVSAKEKKGLEDLLEAILLVTDSKEITANPKGRCIGTVIESRLDKTRGAMTTLLVQNGSLKIGDVIVAGEACGKIKAMFNYVGSPIKRATPSTPVVVMGLSDLPASGDLFQVVGDERTARNIVTERKNISKLAKVTRKLTLEELFSKVKAGEVKELRMVVKADVQGSLEPITNSLRELSTKQQDIKVNVLHSETGNITESDVMLAAASNAIIVGFDVDADTAARRLAEKEGVSIRLYNIIYRLLEDIEKALNGMLEPELAEKVIGKANILATFKVSRFDKAAGCRVTDGEFRRNAKVRVLRGGKVIFTGELGSLKREKEDVREVKHGFECGMAFKDFTEFDQGDTVECFVIEQFGA